ncbi:MAG: tetraacyldisaccharide 4'-kinase [Betaproteobacteria bacterium]|jgi:tetraacyldisaccharide 4'-kinase|nr:tetraacyldisaccharide 4'-kinase [Rhodocyclaceae bacterium]MCA3140991.1 tetraacyldisaccharide 4'-kinase [Rhodocyclaceae bacterium]
MGIETHWQRTGAVALVLSPLAAVFALVAAVRRALFALGVLRSVRLPVPVVVVGNITVGGTGKTPLVAWLAGELLARNRRPGIVTRGYGARTRGPERVEPDSDPALVGDEAVLLARQCHCPVFRGADRVAAARALLAAHPDTDVLLSDDGLQHYRLGRDLEIAVVDGMRGLGNGLPLPSGPLREPAARLARCRFVVVKAPVRAALPPHPARGAMQLEPGALRSLTDPERTLPLGALAGLRVHAVAGIGNPDHFFDTLRSLGITFEAHPFPDHHIWKARDLRFPGAQAVLMTVKDAVKCHAFAEPIFWELPVTARLDPHFAAALLAAIPHGPRSKTA